MPGPSNRPSQAGKGGIYYGWIVVAAAFLVTMTVGEAFFSFSAFFKPLEAEFGWSRAVISSAYTAFLVSYSVSAFFMGKLGDKYGPRLVISIGGLITGGGLMLASQVESIWQLRGTLLLAGLGAGSAWPVPVSTVSRWFVRRRGLVLGLAGAGVGVGAVVFVPLTNYLISAFGWRNAYLVVGALYLVIMVTAARMMVHSPEKRGLKPYGAELAAQGEAVANPTTLGMTLGAVVRTRTFYALTLSMLIIQAPTQILVVHLIPFATDVGVAAAVAAAALGLMGGFSIPGRVLGGAVSDRIGWNRAMGLSGIGTGLSVLYLITVKDQAMLYGFVLAFGFLMGARNPAQVGILGQFFGTRALGELIGLNHGFFMLTGALGPYLAGYIYDATGTYAPAFLLVAFCYILGGLLMLTIKPPAPPASARQG